MGFFKRIAVAFMLAVCGGGTAAHLAQASDDTFVASAGQAVVTIAQGQLMGFRDRGIYTFRGVPYAKASRFMPPASPDRWQGVRLAMNYGESCPQPVMTQVSNDQQFNAHRYLPENENCQFLNVWTPGLQTQAKRPVIVFIHGGGFTSGSTIETEGYDGRNLAELGDVVMVSMTHRLSVLGALDLTAYGPKYAQSSNLGMRDIVAALEWVHANIAQFGGDPTNVTIVGQSGGGGKVRTLMGIPAAKDLFARAIVMSGTSGSAAVPKAVGSAIAKHTLENLRLTPRTIDKILTTPYPELAAAADKAMGQLPKDGLGQSSGWRPTVDGTFIALNPEPDGAERYSSDKPLLIGNVLEEQNTVIRNPNTPLFADNWAKWTDATAMAKLKERYGTRAESVAAAWRKAYPRETLARSLVFNIPNRATTLSVASLKASHGNAPVYNYVYTWNPPVLDGVAGSWHVADVDMAFFNVDRVPQSFGGGEGARSMSYDMARAWIAFARTGNPGHSGLPDWPAFTQSNNATMIFSDYPTVGVAHDAEFLKLIQGN